MGPEILVLYNGAGETEGPAVMSDLSSVLKVQNGHVVTVSALSLHHSNYRQQGQDNWNFGGEGTTVNIINSQDIHLSGCR